MAIRNSTPVSFLPLGLSDAIDQSSAFPGACQLLQNLIFDRRNRGATIPKPGTESVTTFPGFNAPGIVSVAMTVGTLIYGLIESDLYPGFDEPFCYNTETDAFISISGTTGANLPATQATTGEWTPPTADVVGIYLVITHPGFSGANYFGWINISNPASPAWSGGNTTTNALPSIPLWVVQFFGRAYFGLGNKVYFTDSLSLAISNPNFAAVLTVDDTSDILGACGLPVANTTGGILQSIVLFKQNSIHQISGDIALTNLPLSLNKLASNVGCVMPRTIQSTPIGIIFISTDGPRIVTASSEVVYLKSGDAVSPDIVYPFTNATYPSRACAVYNNGIYRVCFDGAFSVWDSSYTSGDYWFDLIFGRWNGPHTFPYHCATAVNGVFYLMSNIYPGVMFTSTAIPSSTSVYEDSGMAYNCGLVSTAIAGAAMTMSAIPESTIELCGSAIGVSYYISIYDDQNNPLSPATISLSNVNPLWGANRWAMFSWRSSIPTSHTYTIPWVNVAVTKKVILSVVVAAAENVSIKEAMFRFQILGYTNS